MTIWKLWDLLLYSVLVVCIGCSTTQTSTKRSSNYYWGQTQFYLNELDQVISSENCYTHENKFTGCIAALEKLLFLAPEPQWLLPLSMAKKHNLPTLKIIDGLALINVPQDKKDFEKGEYENSVKDLFRSNKQIKFSSLLLRFKGQIKEQSFYGLNEQYLAAQAYNSYLHYAIDPYTRLIPIDKTFTGKEDESTTQVHDRFGFNSKVKEGVVKIIRVSKGSNAHKKGLHFNDQVKAYYHYNNKIQLNERNFDLFKSYIGDQSHKEIKVEVVGKGLITLNRTPFNDPSYELKTYNLLGKKVVYLKYDSFDNQLACQELKDALLNIKQTDAFAVDLRDNTGGYIATVSCLADIFLPPSSLIYKSLTLKEDIRFKDEVDSEMAAYAGAEGHFKTPLYVLINQSSASASEIFAAAVKDNHRGILLGSKSFGKGVGQSHIYKWDELPYLEKHKDAVVALTDIIIQRPNGESVHNVGIAPDIEVTDSIEEQDSFKFNTPLSFKAKTKKACLNKELIKSRTEFKKQINKQALESPDLQLQYSLDFIQCHLQG